MEKNIITVTSPLLPDLDEFYKLLKDIWCRKWLTNNGTYHKALESALCEYLSVPYISLFTNGTLPLITVGNKRKRSIRKKANVRDTKVFTQSRFKRLVISTIVREPLAAPDVLE